MANRRLPGVYKREIPRRLQLIRWRSPSESQPRPHTTLDGTQPGNSSDVDTEHDDGQHNQANPLFGRVPGNADNQQSKRENHGSKNEHHFIQESPRLIVVASRLCSRSQIRKSLRRNLVSIFFHFSKFGVGSQTTGPAGVQ